MLFRVSSQLWALIVLYAVIGATLLSAVRPMALLMSFSGSSAHEGGRFGCRWTCVLGDASVKGIGDFDGDGRDDILMQRFSDGMLSLWKMDGLTVTSQTNIAAVNPAQWTLHDVGDYNGDGKDDILWQKSDGLVFLWLMNGATITGTAGLSGLDHSWGII